MSNVMQVFVTNIVCHDPDTVTTKDKASFIVAAVTDSGKGVKAFGPLYLDAGEHYSFYGPAGLIYEGPAETPVVAVAIKGWDLDENKGWADSEEVREKVVDAVSGAVSFIPGKGKIIGYGIKVGHMLTDAIVKFAIELDDDDIIFDYSGEFPINASPYNLVSRTQTLTFERRDPTGHRSSKYSVDLVITAMATPAFAGGAAKPDDAHYLATFRARNEYAWSEGFVGAFPNFFYATRDGIHFAGTTLLNSAGAELGEATAAELGDMDPNIFRDRIRNAHRYALQKGFAGALPTFTKRKIMLPPGETADVKKVTAFPREVLKYLEAPKASDGSSAAFRLDLSPRTWFDRNVPFDWEREVKIPQKPKVPPQPRFGLLLFKPSHAERRDVAISALGNPAVDDHGAWFRGAAEYAAREGFLAAYPTFITGQAAGVATCGIVAIKPGAGEWRDVIVGRAPT